MVGSKIKEIHGPFLLKHVLKEMGAIQADIDIISKTSYIWNSFWYFKYFDALE